MGDCYAVSLFHVGGIMLTSRNKERSAFKKTKVVALNALLGSDKDDVREIACQQTGLAYRRVRAGKCHPGKPVRMDRYDLAPDSAFLPSWEIVEPNGLGRQVVGYERGIFGEGDPHLMATRANGRPLADLR